MHCLDMAFAFILGVNEHIIQIHNDKGIELFYYDLIDVVLEYCRSIGQSKRHHLIFEVAVSGPESSLPLIFLANSYLVIGTSEVELDKQSCSSQSVQGLSNQRQWISVFYGEVIKSPIINAKPEATIWLFIKKDGSSC